MDFRNKTKQNKTRQNNKQRTNKRPRRVTETHWQIKRSTFSVGRLTLFVDLPHRLSALTLLLFFGPISENICWHHSREYDYSNKRWERTSGARWRSRKARSAQPCKGMERSAVPIFRFNLFLNRREGGGGVRGRGRIKALILILLESKG